VPNPLVDQGTLNRIRASVVWSNFPQLNVTSPYLGREGIRLALEGNATDYFGTMTGAVPSPAPYQICTLTLNLIKSQPLGQVYKSQFELSTLLGYCTVRPDSGPNLDGNIDGIGIYDLYNVVLETVREMTFAGEDPTYVVTCKGYYLVNSVLFNS
jgi:hypothetical protein